MDLGVPARDAVCVTAEVVVESTRLIALAKNVRAVHLLLRQLARARVGVVGSKL